MAKAPAVAPVENLPAAPGPHDLISEEMLDLTEKAAGRGVSFKAEDQLLPLIYILQTNSPSVDERGDAYIIGAKPGHFWLRNALEPIRDGIAGIDVIPCEMVRTWIEWLPNRGGFVTRHPKPPEDMILKNIRGDDGREKQILVRGGNGNIIQDTREFYLIVDAMPYVLPCTGTKHTFAKQWQTMFHQYKHPRTNAIMPAYARKYKLTTVPQSNASGKWFGLKFDDLGMVTVPEFKAADSFYNAVVSGEKRAEAPIAGAEHAESSTEIPF